MVQAAIDIYQQINDIARQVERDEAAIKRAVIVAIERGDLALARRVMVAWLDKPPIEVVESIRSNGHAAN